MSDKLRVGILFGGKSAEHEVSLQSAKNVIDALDKNKYEVVLIGIDKQGSWLLNDTSQFLLDAQNPKLIKLNQSNDAVTLAPQGGGALTHLASNQIDAALDVVFPILHGPFGEDGTVQGLLKLAGVPFVGSGILGSAVGMDKEIMKRLLREADLPVGPFFGLPGASSQPQFRRCRRQIGPAAVRQTGESRFVRGRQQGDQRRRVSPRRGRGVSVRSQNSRGSLY